MPRFDSGMELMYVYSDIITETQIGGTYSPVFRLVHLSETLRNLYSEDGDIMGSCKMSFDRPHYQPISQRNIKQIHIELRDRVGDLMQFLGGVTVLIVQFRKIKYKKQRQLSSLISN